MNASGDAGIGAVLNFTYEELQLNRAGRLSERQLARLSTSRKRGRAFTVVMAVLVVGFVVLIVTLLLPKLTENQAYDSVPIAPIVIGVLVLMFVLVGSSIFRTRRSLDQLTGKLKLASGPAKTRAHRLPGNIVDASAPGLSYGGGIRHELTIGSVRFFVSGQAVLDAFQDGRPYFGYYVGRGVMNTLVSAESADGRV